MTREEEPDSPRSDELLRASKAGDDTALEALLTRHYAMVRAFVRLRVDPAIRSRESVSDLVQSVCREVLARAEDFDFRGEPAFRAWLCEAALRKLRDRRDYHRAQMRDPAREALPTTERGWVDLADTYRTTLDPVGRALRAEEVTRLEQAFDALSPEQREVLTLRRICELPYAEIAARTNQSEESVRKTVSRACARLATRLAEPPAGG